MTIYEPKGDEFSQYFFLISKISKGRALKSLNIVIKIYKSKYMYQNMKNSLDISSQTQNF